MKSSRETPGPALRRVRWILGTTYTVQGSSSLAEVPTLYFLKFVLEMGDAGGQLFQSLKSLGWLIKPVWGWISDRFPLFGYRRRSWFILMALLAFVFWAATALLSLSGLRVPVLYLIGFNLAFSTYAFVDVVSDALLVENGRRLRRVGGLVNFAWTMLALSNAVAAVLGGWFQEEIQAGNLAYWMVFLASGVPPLFTALVGALNIQEQRVGPRVSWNSKASPRWRPDPGGDIAPRLRRAWHSLRSWKDQNEVMIYLILFIVMWNFSPSIGFIERSYLIDVRGFTPGAFGAILTAQALTFLVSILVYRLVVRRWRDVQWYHYLYAVIGLMVLAFPLSFYLYLEPGHAWWAWIDFLVPASWSPVPGWNRYEWFRLLFSIAFGFATIPAFIIPLRLAGEAVKIESAGMGYAFLMSLTNITNVFEGVVGSGLYQLLTRPWMSWLLDIFHQSWLDIAGVSDERTLILQIFVYISLFFTLLAIPFVYLVKGAFERHGIEAVDIEPVD